MGGVRSHATASTASSAVLHHYISACESPALQPSPCSALSPLYVQKLHKHSSRYLQKAKRRRGLHERTGDHIANRTIVMAGSVKHILLLKFKDSIVPDQQSVLIQKYAGLPNSISAMKGFEWGTDMSVENMNQGFTHVFISTFDSPEGRDEYLVHPVHEAFAKELLAALDNALVVDFKPTVVVKAA